MDLIISKLKEGNRFCAHTLSPDCLVLANKNRFVGSKCGPCHKQFTKEYYCAYHKKNYTKKIRQLEIKNDLKKKNNNILDFLNTMNDDEFIVDS